MSYQRHCPGCFRRKGGQAICEHCGYDESAPQPAIYLPQGSVLAGRWRVGRVLGRRQDFGITYLGWDISQQQRVAIKEFLPPQGASRVPEGAAVTVQDEARRDFDRDCERFLAEAEAVAAIRHPNLVRVRTQFRSNDTAYLVMDYYEGATLDACLAAQRGPLEAGLALSLVRQSALALRELHARGLHHGDVQPDNIYLAAAGRVVLMDVDLAPEAASHPYAVAEPPGVSADLYALSATLYRLLSGRLPPLAAQRARSDELADDLAWVGIPAAAAELCRRGLALDPAQRWPDMDALIAAIDTAVPAPADHREEIVAMSRAGAGPRPPRIAPPEPVPQGSAPEGHHLSFVLLGAVALTLLAASWMVLSGGGIVAKPEAPDRPLTAGERTLLPAMRDIPAGSLHLSGDAKGELPMPAYRMSRSEVTVAQFRLFVQRSGYRNPHWPQLPCIGAGDALAWDKPGYDQGDNYPVTCVSAADAAAYADWLSRQTGQPTRLPTEAEWEYAARGGSNTAYWWGAAYDSRYADCAGCAGRWPRHPGFVGARPANGFGLVDVAGNVREWTCSAYAPPQESDSRRCLAPLDEGANLVVRGGSWQELAEALQVDFRRPFNAWSRNVWTGFRVVEVGVAAGAD